MSCVHKSDITCHFPPDARPANNRKEDYRSREAHAFTREYPPSVRHFLWRAVPCARRKKYE